MAKIKKISELEQLSSLSSSANIIIEEDGKAKRFAASKIAVGDNGGVSVQPDWDQTDDTAKDYIKNRTHYDEGKEVKIELMPSTDLTFELYEGMMDFYSDEVDFVIEEGEKYLVTIDGNEYIDTAVKSEDLITLGESIVKIEIGSSLGVPVTYNRPYVILYNGFFEIMMLTSTETTHNVSISKIESLVHKEIYNESNTKFDYANGQYGKYLFDMDAPIAGLDYTVIWDGTEYVCKAFSPAEGLVFFGNLAIMGGEDTGEPFIFVSQGGMINAFMDIVNMYMPEETKTVNVSIDKQLEDGTHEGVVANSECELAYSSDMSVYMSGAPIDGMLELGSVYKVVYNNTEYICTCTDLGGILVIGNPTIIPQFASYENNGEPFLIGYIEGTGIMIYSSAKAPAVYHDVNLSGYISGVKKLDKKYLPDDIGITVASDTNIGGVKVWSTASNLSNNSSYSKIYLDTDDNTIYAAKPTMSNLTIGNQTYNGSSAVSVTSLKNPYALTFTGGVTGSYDGSSSKTVNIPTSLKNPYALTFTGAVTGSYN
ncbi:MAG: hypothetical protein UHE62_00935, partial [Muribaculaceae bacterium]|nr:hypothetical protein [Muribaculaceae bacterium]